MCGIAGILYTDRARKAQNSLITRMADRLAHRGPDDAGILVEQNVALGFRRLSIIDLSAAAHQPISNEDSSVWGVFNGEIYNFKDLRFELESRGHHFKSRCDSEVLLHAYEEYGTECVKHFNGMFAFALWDKKKELVFCGRDRTGEKPFFYALDNERFIFASEIKAILEDANVSRDIDFDALNAYFSYMYVPEPRTIFKEIKKLSPAEILVCQKGKISIAKYWDVDYGAYLPKSVDECKEKLRYLLEDAVKIRMHSDVPLGIFLSGGIDSSSIVAIAAGISGIPVKTFSVSGGAGVFNELAYARIAAGAAKSEHTEFKVTTENIRCLLPKLIGFIDEPFADSSIIPAYYISKISREKVTVALSGEGGDEVFGGYLRYKKDALIGFLHDRPWLKGLIRCSAKVAALVPEEKNSGETGLAGILGKLVALNRLCASRDEERYETLMQVFPKLLKARVFSERVFNANRDFTVMENYAASAAPDRLNKALYADLKTYLPGDLLVKIDRMSMSNALEVRAPFLDHRIIEFMAGIPPQFKIRGGLTKYLLRKSMEGIVPRAILNRRDKRGFSVPVGSWLRGDLGDWAREILLDTQTLRRGIFLKTGVEDMLKLHRQRKSDYGHQIWTLLVFELWARQYQ